MPKLLALAATVLLLSTVAASADPSNATERNWPYYTVLQVSIRDYFIVNGEWPATWQAVRDAGLFTARTKTVDGLTIDPDDNSLDFAGDIVYTYHGLEQPELTVWSIERGEKFIADRRIPAVTGGKASESELDAVQMRLLNNLFQAVGHFAFNHGRLPVSWNEFVDSGVTPIDSLSVNPLTGQRYTGAGIPGDFLFETRKNVADNFEVRVQWVDLDGRAVNYGGDWFSLPEDEQQSNTTTLNLVP
jgi:hypothetical protein